MRTLTVLGSCGGWPEPGRATSGFLLDFDGFRVVLDLGFATVPRLLQICPDGDVDAIIITHEHSDHCVDLNALFRARYFGVREIMEGDGELRRIPLFCPAGVVERVEILEPEGQLSEIFQIHELPGSYDLGPLRLEGSPLPHYVPNAGIRLSSGDYTLAYTGDSTADPAIVALGEDADLFVVVANWTGDPIPRHLLTAREAGQYAEQAGASRLLLTHFWPGTDRKTAVSEAAAVFSGEVLAATEGMALEL